MTADRIDAWGATLTEEQRWELYRAHYAHSSWEGVADWAEAELGIERPTRSAYYRFRSRMAERESEHRIEMAITEKNRISREMDVIGEISPELKRAFEQRSLESELRGDHQGAEKWLTLALGLGDAMNKKAALEIKAQAQQRAERQLDLAREKFEAAEARLSAARDAMKRLNDSGGLSPEARAEIEKAMGIL
jgi:hypothetical protein